MIISTLQFVIDSNVLITAKNSYYAFDLCPSFWNWLVATIHNRQIMIIDRVRDELLAGNDNLANWVRSQVSGLHVPSGDASVVTAFSQMMNWVQQNQMFTNEAKVEFASKADGWIAAYASVNHLTVVTLETFDPNIKVRVKLPNVCRQFNIDYINTFELLRRLGIRF